VEVIFFATCFGIGSAAVCVLHVRAEQLLRYTGLRLAGRPALAINTTMSAIAPKVAGHLFDQGVGYATTFYVLAAWGFIGRSC